MMRSMAAIDGLLGLIDLRKASGLLLATGEAPALLVDDAPRPLSMPELTPPMFEALIDEVLGPERRARLREQTSVDLIYTSERTKRSFDVSATSTGERTTLRFVVREASAPVSTAREQPTAAGLEALVESGLDRGASDIVLSEGRSPRLRFAGHLEGGNGAVTTAGEIQAFIDAHMTPELRAQFEATES